MSREAIQVTNDPTTHPPIAEVVTAVVSPGFRTAQLQYDPEWGGGRGSWFCEKGRAIAVKAIAKWYPNHH